MYKMITKENISYSTKNYLLLFGDLNRKEIQKKKGYMYTNGWLIFLYSRKWHAIVKQLYSNTNFKMMEFITHN